MRAPAIMAWVLLVVSGPAHVLAADAALADKKTCRLGAFKYKTNAATLVDCPADVQALIDRALGCQHWTGEEPYDEARGHEIETALTELKCDVLSLDYDELLKKYAQRTDVLATLQAADREYSLEF